MPKLRTPTSSASIRLALCAVLAWAAAGPVSALGLSTRAPVAVLGAPLEAEFTVRVDAGESLSDDCVRAKVQIGDRLLPPEQVRVRLTGLGPAGAGPADARVRLLTLVRVEEPIVEVLVEAGCVGPVSRRYVVFADPPTMAAAAPLADTAAERPAAKGPAPATRAVAAATPGVATPEAAAATSRPAATAERTTPRTTPRPAPPRNVDAPPRRPAQASERKAGAEPAARPAPPPRRQATPRLQLDPVPSTAAAPSVAGPDTPGTPGPAVLSAEALALVEQANDAVKAAIVEVRAAQARMAALEAQVANLTAQLAAQRAAAERLQAQAAEAQARSRWVAPLALAFFALVALAAWLWWRLRTLDREPHRDWHAEVRRPSPLAAKPVAPVAAATATATPAAASPEVTRVVRGAGLAPAHQPTPSEWEEIGAQGAADSPTIRGWTGHDTAAGDAVSGAMQPVQDVTAEELIDLEQQAEFFIVLGQDEAAVDLLMTHVRDTGGASPLPYLKLMDIYRRLGQEDDYRRTQDRFNQRFNARAPAWDDRDQAGRGLDGYPTVMAELQRVWRTPLDAMAELEALLFRREGGAVFELEAYRDLLLLYGVARAAQEAAGRHTGTEAPVDVLLPLDSVMDSLFETPADTRPGPMQP